MSRSSNKQDKSYDADELFLENVLSFDGTSLRFDRGFEVTIQIAQCEVTEERPHGFNYAFTLVGPDYSGQRVRLLGRDNAHAGKGADRPYDHEHRERRNRAGGLVEAGPPVAKPLTNIQEAIGEFFEKAQALVEREGVDTSTGTIAQMPRVMGQGSFTKVTIIRTKSAPK